MYRERWYREGLREGRFRPLAVIEGESDLWIGLSDCDTEMAAETAASALSRDRSAIALWIASHPEFKTSLEPLTDDGSAPAIVRRMLRAGLQAGVGPMAGVAGAIAESIGRELLSMEKGPREIIVENGGDIWLSVAEPVVIGVYAGLSGVSGRIGLEIAPDRGPLGICTSSAKVGPSLSAGNADAFLVACADAALADALATAYGNKVRIQADLESAVEEAGARDDVLMALGIKAGVAAMAGSLRVVPVGKPFTED